MLRRNNHKKRQIDISKKIVCINVRDSFYLNKILPNNLNYYHDRRDADINNYITQQELQTPMLPQTPMPNQNVIQASIKAQATEPLNDGLTNTENALLSQEEKMIRLRQRGLA